MLTDNTDRVLSLINHDEQFEFNQHEADTKPVILNKFDLTLPNFIEQLSSLVFSDANGNDFIARCECGATEGNNKIEMICPICKTEVTKSNLLSGDNLIAKNWLSAPKELEHGWLSPKVYMNLATWLSYNKGKNNYLDDILDIDATLPHDIVEVVRGQGFDYLFKNFDRIIDFFVYDHPVISKKPDTSAMKFFLRLNKDRLFCHYIPILNSAISPIISSDSTGTSKRQYSDVTPDHVLRAATSLSRLEFSTRRIKPEMVERTAFKAFKDIILYIEEATKKYISTKKAIPRTHIYGSRFHWSFRGVVIPITGPHYYWELHVPWKMAVNTLRVHIYGVLLREYQMSINETVSRVREALSKVDPLIQQIMNRMIEESPFPGIPCVWDRPPSIRDGSVMLKYWTVIKTDIEDYCVSISPLDVALPNADFDGDNLAGVILPETEMVHALRGLSPANLIFNRNTGEVSNEIGINKTLAVTWNSFLDNV